MRVGLLARNQMESLAGWRNQLAVGRLEVVLNIGDDECCGCYEDGCGSPCCIVEPHGGCVVVANCEAGKVYLPNVRSVDSNRHGADDEARKHTLDCRIAVSYFGTRVISGSIVLNL